MKTRLIFTQGHPVLLSESNGHTRTLPGKGNEFITLQLKTLSFQKYFQEGFNLWKEQGTFGYPEMLWGLLPHSLLGYPNLYQDTSMLNVY